ncbi:hypothetical protein ES705_30228 [subsurface metagenome]
MKNKNNLSVFLIAFFLTFSIPYIGGKSKIQLVIDNEVNQFSGVEGNVDNFPIWDDGPEISSGYWTLSPFTIDDDGYGDYTWAQAVNEDWCSGSGTLNDPYIIEKLLIDGQTSINCITISNSSAYFKIIDSTLFNASAAVYLKNVSNGIIEYNNLSNNLAVGIEIDSSLNIKVLNNVISKNTHIGIFLYNSNETVVYNNKVTHNFGGIISYFSNTLNISGNYVVNNSYYGINTRDANQIYIFNNLVVGNIRSEVFEYTIGIFVNFCNNSTVINNQVLSNFQGIYSRGEYNYIASNLIKNNNYTGLVVQQSYYSIYFNNTIVENERGISADFGTNIIYMNYLDNLIENAYDYTSEQNLWFYNNIGN